MTEQLEQIKVGIEALGILGGLVAFFRAIGEYRRQNNIKAFENFKEMTKRFNESEPIQRVLKELNTDDEDKIATLSTEDKDVFISFHEEVSIMRNSGLISDEVALYMFAHDAIAANKSIKFWKDMDEQSHYWSEFKYFCTSMKDLEVKYGNKWPEGQIRFTHRRPLSQDVLHIFLGD